MEFKIEVYWLRTKLTGVIAVQRNAMLLAPNNAVNCQTTNM
jgi:hypothetical protein